MEIVAISQIGLDDAPAADKLAPAGAVMSLRQPHQIVGGGREGEGPFDAVAAAQPRTGSSA